MIQLHKITKAIKNFLKWLIVTNYGRFVLGALLAITGIFSQYGTIDFLTTDLLFFEITCNTGIVILILQFLWVIVRATYLYFTDRWD